MSFNEKLINLLKTDRRFIDDEGELLLSVVQDCAWKTDNGLIKLLLADKEIKAAFFIEIEGHWIFNFNIFIDFISQKNFLDNSYTRFRNRIGLTIDNKFLRERGEVALVWPYKDCILEGGQTKDQETRSEIFFNELLARDEINRLLDEKAFTNFIRYYRKHKEKVEKFHRNDNGIINENIIIKGNNLLTIESLKSNFRAQIKVVYIDPPYNPDSKSNTFVYNNNFNHSSWLTFMKNRLEVAKELLTKDGVLIVAIDDNEVFYLGVLLHEIFNDYEIHCITIIHNPRGVQGTNFSYVHEYAFFVIPAGKKVIGNRKINPEDIDWSPLRNWGGESRREDAKNCFYPIVVKDGEIIGFGNVLNDGEHPSTQTEKKDNHFLVYPIDRNGVERKWRYARQTIEEVKHLLRPKRIENGYDIEIGKDFGVFKSVWEDSRYDANAYGTQLVKSLVPGCAFDFPKSLWNVFDCLYSVVANDKNAIILDFFGGSGTTAHAVLELNKDGGKRKFIICEQMDYINTVTVPRVQRVIEEHQDENFIYFELMKYNQIFIEKIQNAETSQELYEIWRNMAEGSFLNWYVNPNIPADALKDFEAIGSKVNGFEAQKHFLCELLDKNQLYINFSEINDDEFKVTDEDKNLNKSFYGEAYGA